MGDLSFIFVADHNTRVKGLEQCRSRLFRAPARKVLLKTSCMYHNSCFVCYGGLDVTRKRIVYFRFTDGITVFFFAEDHDEG